MKAATKKTRPLEVIPERVAAIAAPVPVPGARLAKLVKFEAGRIWIEADAAHGPIPARTTLALDARALALAVAARREALVVYEDAREDRPIVIGLLDPPERERSIEARVDGKRVVLDAEDEIVLRCGEASLTLRRNGRVVVRGAYVETRAKGVNRIKGGSVQIN